jgi:hypothetical protein
MMENSNDIQVELYHAETANLQKLHSGYEPRWRVVPSPHTRCSDLDAAMSKIAILKKNDYPNMMFKIIWVFDQAELYNEFNP